MLKTESTVEEMREVEQLRRQIADAEKLIGGMNTARLENERAAFSKSLHGKVPPAARGALEDFFAKAQSGTATCEDLQAVVDATPIHPAFAQISGLMEIEQMPIHKPRR